MNARQAKKRLKKEIAKLKSDNDLMFRIISNSQEMSELYDAYTKPVKFINTTIPIQELKARMVFPAGRVDVHKENIEYVTRSIAEKLFEDIEAYIIYDVDSNNGWLTQVTGSIFVGIKNKEN